MTNPDASDSAKSFAELVERFNGMVVAGCGLLTIEVFAARCVPEVAEEAVAGDPEAQRLLGMFESTADRIDARATTAEPCQCLLCDTQFGNHPGQEWPEALVVVQSDGVQPGQAPVLLQMLCARCEVQPRIQQQVLAALRRYLGANLRTVQHHAPGHA